MFVAKDKAQKFSIPGGTNGLLYPPSPKGDQSMAVIEMDGVYPEKGHSLNDICTETIYQLEGQFRIEVNGQWHELKSGDLLMILPGNKYKVTGKGKACVLISPSWDSKQNHIVTE